MEPVDLRSCLSTCLEKRAAARKKATADRPRIKRILRYRMLDEKVEAVRRVLAGQSKANVSRDFNVPESTLRGWFKEGKVLARLGQASSVHEYTLASDSDGARSPALSVESFSNETNEHEDMPRPAKRFKPDVPDTPTETCVTPALIPTNEDQNFQQYCQQSVNLSTTTWMLQLQQQYAMAVKTWSGTVCNPWLWWYQQTFQAPPFFVNEPVQEEPLCLKKWPTDTTLAASEIDKAHEKLDKNEASSNKRWNVKIERDDDQPKESMSKDEDKEANKRDKIVLSLKVNVKIKDSDN